MSLVLHIYKVTMALGLYVQNISVCNSWIPRNPAWIVCFNT